MEEKAVMPTDLMLRGRYFLEENMFARMKKTAEAEMYGETLLALDYMRDRHEGQYRKPAKHTTERVAYINHPLLMTCHAYALGIRDDTLLAAILLHDVVEDTGVLLEELPFSDGVREVVGLVTFAVPEGMTKPQAKDAYYARIKENGRACVVKVLDRCNNVSTMAGSFSREKLIEYINETEKYVMPLFEVLKEGYPEYATLAFVVKYHLISVLESIKCMMIDYYS